jgi:hypothetical protein
MRHFCTYFDSNYFLRGLTLYRSLQATGCEFTLHVLALDERTHSTLSALRVPDLRSIRLDQLESWEPALQVAKTNRKQIEYYFTLSPILPLFILEGNPSIEIITYLDADLYFYRSPEPLFRELGDQSILITEHRFPQYLREKEKFGRYNVQYQSFRRDPQGLACLERWKQQCLRWCYDRLEDGKFADQKYLEEWPALYDRLVVSQHKGAAVAPWNWATHPIQLAGNAVTVGGDPLIFFHFHGVKIFNPYFISNGLVDFGLMPYMLRRWFYVGYLRQLRATKRWLGTLGIDGFMLRDRFLRSGGIRDRYLRGGAIKTATLAEIVRKAWGQSMITL